MLETFETIFDVFWHQEMPISARVVPFYGEPAVSFSFRLDRALVICSDCLQKVLGMFLANVFDAKVIDDQRERDGAPLVRPQAGSGLAL